MKLDEIKLEKGDIYHIEGADYVAFHVSEDIIGFIQKDKGQFINMDANDFMKRALSGEYVKVLKEEESALPSVPDNELEHIREISIIMDQLLEDYYPAWDKLTLPTKNNDVEKAASQAGCCVKHFRRLFYRYLRSGCDMFSLVDNRHLRGARARIKAHAIDLASGETMVLLQKEEALLYGLNVFKEFHHVGKAHDEMTIKYYSDIKSVMENGVLQPYVTQRSDALSYYTLYRYISKNLGGKSIREYIRGEKENRNNHRPLTGNQRSGIISIGQAGQMDESEFAVNVTDGNGRVIGKVVVYCHFDPAAQMITGLAPGLYNNYIGGVINTLFTMLEPHENQTKLVGVHCDEYSFPSMYLPKIIYDDRGSEYQSIMMKEIMHELGIIVKPVPVAAGSYKGGAENAFHRFQSRLKRELLNDGYILIDDPKKPYFAKENAVLTIDDFKAMTYRIAIEVNTTNLGEKFSPDKELIENNIPPVPSEIWKYKIKTHFNPTSITDTNRRQKSFCLLWRDKQFTIGRDGITYKGHNLRYFTDKEWFHDMINSGKKDEIDIRYNDADITHIYVRYKDVIYDPIPLAQSRDELRSFAGLSWDAYDELWKEYEKTKKAQEKKDRNTHLTTVKRNNQTLAIARAAHDGIINDVKSIPEARALERVRLENDPNEIRNRILGINPMEMKLPEKTSDEKNIPDGVPSEQKSKYTDLSDEELASLIADEEG